MRWLCGALLPFSVSTALTAQGYHVRLDTRFQAVEFRGVSLDSIATSDTVTGPGGGPTTPDGYAVHCAAGDAYCTFFRRGAVRRGVPIVTTGDLTAWGFGVRGLSIHATARLGVDLGNAAVWPGTDPAVQVLNGYVEYAAERITARAGRQTVFSRFGTTGFDGAAVSLRLSRSRVEANAYAGWQLARGVALPVTSPALNPLDDFQPRRRQLVAGFETAWTGGGADLRVIYQREVDPQSDYFVSERLAISGNVRPAVGLSISGGADYDLAAGWWGSADLRVAYTTGVLTGSVGGRRYRPHFDLWTIWGAFSPVPYRAVQGDLAIRATRRIGLHARGERYRFDAADVSTPLVRAERDGWRGELGATVLPAPGWTLDGGYMREFGPGAAIAGVGASVTYAPTDKYRLTLHGSSLDRPLEFRFSESMLRVYGIEADGDLSERLRVSLGASRYAEERHRPDAAAFDWGQWRVTARVILLFARGGDLENLPPAIRRMPSGRNAR